MLVKGWITGECRQTDQNRRARDYQLMSSGRHEFNRHIVACQRVTGAIARVLQMA
jgi:PadR family transcriptional regulator, regulatory protein PadR